MENVIFDSNYWLLEVKRTETELSELINGDLSSIKTVKSDEDTTMLQDIEKLMKVKTSYISYCKNRYEEELNKENRVEKSKSILYFDREFGY
ncbi:MAG: hypothetical protein ACRCZ0_01810 [Cetobacterium sp.]